MGWTCVTTRKWGHVTLRARSEKVIRAWTLLCLDHSCWKTRATMTWGCSIVLWGVPRENWGLLPTVSLHSPPAHASFIDGRSSSPSQAFGCLQLQVTSWAWLHGEPELELPSWAAPESLTLTNRQRTPVLLRNYILGAIYYIIMQNERGHY